MQVVVVNILYLVIKKNGRTAILLCTFMYVAFT